MALDILGQYFSDSAVSVLSQTFIEIEDPIATSIYCSLACQLPSTFSIYFDSVPAEHLDTVETKLFDCFQKVAMEGMDMERMKTVIEKARDKYVLDMETSPANFLSHKLINEALYGDLSGKTLEKDVKDLIYYDILSKWTSAQWVALLKKFSFHHFR